VDYQYHDPAINPIFKHTSLYFYYWSSTTASRTKDRDAVFRVHFSDGHSVIDAKWINGFVRCVRGGKYIIKPISK